MAMPTCSGNASTAAPACSAGSGSLVPADEGAVPRQAAFARAAALRSRLAGCPRSVPAPPPGAVPLAPPAAASPPRLPVLPRRLRLAWRFRLLPRGAGAEGPRPVMSRPVLLKPGTPRRGRLPPGRPRPGKARPVMSRPGTARRDGAAGESAARGWAGADALPCAARPGPSGVLALGGSGRGWRGRTDGPPLVDSSAAASCSGRGRDTSLARMAALSVIFIPGMGTLHRYPFQPAANQSRESMPKSGAQPAGDKQPAVREQAVREQAVREQTCRWRGEASRRGVYFAAGDVRPATDRRASRGRRPCPADATARRASRGRRPCPADATARRASRGRRGVPGPGLRRWSGTRVRDPRTSRPTVPRARRRAPPWPAPPGPGSRARSRRDTPRPAWLRAG